VNLTFYIGETDNVLYMFGKSVADGSDLSGILEVHSNISFGATFPDEYWKYDFPLMGEAATVTEPPPLRQSELVKQLPTITVQDINGQTFTVSADNKKAVLFYFFTPGSAQYYIDDVQQLHEEGEVRSLQVIGIAESSGPPADRTHEGLLAFMAKHHITFPVYAEESLFKSYVKEQLKNRAGGGPPLIYGKDGQLKSDATYFHTHELRAAVNSIAPIIGK
jgi:peroxiredoxin